ncbi:MAG TPA: RNA methyltransferase [Candidatus Eisenbacteria bacterium]|uniref:RNA methyltransferase n=1 Tax=Eiseniibacteriota bacterium TaxID=2212470 RepID=A0A7V2AW65_UNCEI|nr:RNA methyltransferase [Candidatus Eisenbacteria bacterium]
MKKPITPINSTQNPRIKALVRLRNARGRDSAGLVLIEGTKELSRALESGILIEEIYYRKSGDLIDLIESLMNRQECSATEFFEVNTTAFEKISYRAGSSGIIAVAERPERSLKDIPSDGNPLYIVMDGIEKPGNLGAVLRSADGAGVTGVIASDERADPYNPNVIRASLGTIFTVPTVVTTAGEAIHWLRSKGVRIVVTTPAADTLYTDADMTGPAAIVVGSEDRGARREWLEAADLQVRIPMLGAADSLNVAQSATIIVYEALRQRSAVGGS